MARHLPVLNGWMRQNTLMTTLSETQNAFNLVSLFMRKAEENLARPFLWAKKDGQYQSLTWEAVQNQILALATSLKNNGLGQGDRVILVAENRPEWLIADLAIMAIGAITVPAYTTNTVSDHAHVLTDSGARAAIVSTAKLAAPLLEAADGTLETVIAMEPVDGTLHWNKVTTTEINQEIATSISNIPRTQTACIIYTSGTGGVPKGVMLSHGAILCNCAGATDALMELGLNREVFLSFLPLSHSYEHTAGQFFPISIGAEIYYADGVESLATNMLEARPTIMTAVPRLYEMLHAKITKGVTKAGGTKEKLFNKTLVLGGKRYEQGRLGLFDVIPDMVLNKLVRQKVRDKFGGRLKALVSGGAPLNPEIGIFFTALGLRILQGYGQTESAPVISCNRPLKSKIHTVGPPLLGVDLKIADDGEILVRGELVMQGYWQNEEATVEAIKDGWLHTGDIGHQDDDGFIIITDRKKDIIVNSGGDNISPQRVEGLLTMEPEIAQAMVYGDKRPHLVALIVPDEEWLKGWTRENQKPSDLISLHDDTDLIAALGPALRRVNAKASTIEKVRRIMIATSPFTIENELLTPTLKVRRHKIKAIYGDQLEALYR